MTEGHPGVKSMFAEHRKDLGPLRIQMQHLPEEKIAAIEDILFTTERPAQERFFEGRGINFRTGDIELWPTEFFLCGGHGLTGVMVNEQAEASIPGLYAAGDVSNVARGHLSGAFAVGEIAAEAATAYGQGLPTAAHDPRQVDALQDRLAEIEGRQGDVHIEEFEYKVRRLINDYVAPPKNAYKLDQALTWMERFRKELASKVRVGGVYDLFKTLEVENILGCATLSATASEARKESRWGFVHRRSDYPETDDERWLKHVVLQRGAADEDVQVSFKPVERMEPIR
jgi:succinate dehydrogenase/fumarate reductase flavoprotein subunit